MKTKDPAAPSVGLTDRAAAWIKIRAVQAVILLTTALGHKGTLRLGSLVGDCLFLMNSRSRQKIMHNLKLAYGDELSPEEARPLSRKVLRNACKNWAELFFAGGPRKRTVMDSIRIQGRENLDRALATGKGVLAVSAHLGNYSLVGARLAREGYDFTTVVRDLKTRSGSAMYAACRRFIDLPSIPTTPERDFFKSALRILKRNGILGLITDENKRSGGIFVDFFGRRASTAPGPAALAVRTGAVVVPVFIVRREDDTQTILIGKEIARQETGDTEHDLQQITSGFTKAIEDCIRQDPSQWVWTNFRWRTQPWGQSDEAKLKNSSGLKAFKRWIKTRR